MKKYVLILAALCALAAGCSKKSATTERFSSSANELKSDEFGVIDFIPNGELPSSVTFPSIQVQFSEPVASLKELGEPSDKSDIFTIEPPLKGVFRWYGTSLLSFESSEKVIPQKEYTARINPKTKSAGGKPIKGNLTYSFYSEKLKMLSVVPGYESMKKGVYVDSENVPLEEARDIGVYFNSPVNIKNIQKYLTVSSSSHSQYKYTASLEDNNVVHIKLNDASEKILEGETVTVRLAEGACSEEDCVKTNFVQRFEFETIKPFAVEFIDSDPDYFGDDVINPAVIVFNSRIKDGTEAEIAKHITTSIQKNLTAKNISIRGSQIAVHGLPIKYDSEYTLTLEGGITDVYGRTLSLANPEVYTIKVGKARSYVRYKDYGMKMLEAQFAPRLAFEFQNVKQGSFYNVNPLTHADGRVNNGITKTVNLYGAFPDNQKILNVVDLAPFLDKTGSEYHGAVQFNAKVFYEYFYRDWNTDELKSKTSSDANELTVQVTDLGATARYGHNEAAVLVTSLKTGKSVEGAEVTLYEIPWDTGDIDKLVKNSVRTKLGSAKTNASGLAVVRYNGLYGSDVYVEVKTSDDCIIYKAKGNHNIWSGDVESTKNPEYAPYPDAVTFIFSDRGLYKPGETITFRGIDRTLQLGEYEPYAGGGYTVKFEEASWDPEVFVTIEGAASQNGTFWGTVKIPEDLKPGTYNLTYRRDDSGEKSSCRIQVQFFERLRFEVASSIPAVPYYSGDNVSADIQAKYLGGGNLNGAAYSVSWSREAASFYPKAAAFSDMRFGPQLGYDSYTQLDEEDGVLSDDGKVSVSVKTGGEKIKGMAYNYRMEADVSDSGGQNIAAVSRALVHPARFYLGVSGFKNITGFPKKGDAIKFAYVCLTPDETAPSENELPRGKNRKIKIELLREEWKQVQQLGWRGQINSRYERVMEEEYSSEIGLSGSSSPQEFSVTPPKGGAYLLRLSTIDAKGADVITERRFYVSGSDWYYSNRYSADEITLTTDKDLYKVGDKAHILMQSPLPKGKYLITVEREGILSEEVRDIDSPTTVIDIDIKENFVPIMYVALSSYSLRTAEPPKDFGTPDLGKPKGYFGVTALRVDTAPKRFDIQITADKQTYRPGEQAEIKIHASKDGVPLADSEITLMAVDRGVIDLINYHVPDPVEFFYAYSRFPLCVRGGDSRSLLIDPVTYETRNLAGGDSADEDENKIQERKNFEPTALFLPDLVTDENGDVSCTFKLPDSLTAYRITAVGVNENLFALSESQMDVANPVSVRAVLPRKLRLSDTGEAGVTVSNLDSVPHDVTLSLKLYEGVEKTGIKTDESDIAKTDGLGSVVGKSEKTLTVESGKTLPLMFDIHAEKAGWITVEYTVKSDIVNERILLPLEIEKPYIFETVTTVGEVRSSDGEKSAEAEEKIIIPANAEDGRGSLYVQLDPTRLGVLREAVDYVFRYPYGCLEQRSSLTLPLAIFGDYIKVFGLESEVKNPKAVVAKEIKSWASSQKENGGFPYWPGGSYDSPYVSARIAEVIGIAEKNGVCIPNEIDKNALASYLIREAADKLEGYDSKYHSAYKLYDAAHFYYAAAMLKGQVESSPLERIAKAEDADANTLALCALTHIQSGRKSAAQSLAKKIRRYIKLTTRGADIADSSYGNYWSFFTDKSEKFALCLQLFTELNPADEINGHFIYELLALQKAGKGYWKSTAATARVLSAFDVYIRRNNLKDLNFTAQALIDGKKIVDGTFKGMAALPAEKTLNFKDAPLDSVPVNKEVPLTFRKDGEGTLFYTASMKYAIPPERQTARDEGISIFTEIVDVKTGQIVRGDKLKSGNIYRARVVVSTTRNRTFVAVRAPVPAGCEIMNAAFVTTGTAGNRKTSNESDSDYDEYDDDDYYWYGGLSYRGIYDSEVQYFWDYFPRGNQKVEFLFRAVRKGTYGTPSSTAECMYQDEIFGRSAGKQWTIE